MKWINSLENSLIKEIIKIKKTPLDKVFVEGLNLVKTALEIQKEHRIDKILLTESFISKNEKFFNSLKMKSFELIGITEKIANKISDTVTPQGIFAIISYSIKNLSEKEFNKTGIIIILDKIQDPGNMGTIMRTAEAFGVDGVILTSGSCNPLSSKVIRASAGSIFFIPLFKADIEGIEKFINKHSLKLIITEPRAKKMIFEIELTPPLAIVFGNEAQGVSDYFKKLPHVKCRIPHIGRAESLNVAMSASIILYEILKYRTKGIL